MTEHVSPFWAAHLPKVDPEKFRGHGQYLDTSGYNARGIVRHLRDAGQYIDCLTEDEAFGCEPLFVDGRPVSRDLLDSMLEIAFLESCGALSSAARVLDIGAGYGRLAHRITTAFPETFVYCTDALPLSLSLCARYLDFRRVSRAVVVSPDKLAEIGNLDLAVNVHSWSECTREAIRWWLDWLAEREVPRLFILPHTREIAAYSDTAGGGRGESYLPDLEARGYRLAAEWHGPDAQPKDYYLFTRER